MADVKPLFISSWGDIRLFVSSIRWQAGETQTVHNLAAGDVHPVQPRGSQIRTCTLDLMFDDFDGEAETGMAAFRRFAATTRERRLFTHPVDGSYFARIGDFNPEVDQDSVVRATCEFIPDGDVVPVAPAGAGTTATSGETAVSAALDKVNDELLAVGMGFPKENIGKIDFSKPVDASIDVAFAADVSVGASANVSVSASASAGISASVSASAQAAATASAFAFASVYARAQAAATVSAVAQVSAMASASAFAFAYAAAALDADARASVASWGEEDVTTRRVMVDVARLSDSIVTMIEVGLFEDDIQLYPPYIAAIKLGDSIRSAAIAATSETSAVFTMRILEPTALLPLAARIYGGIEAQNRAAQILSLNDIRTPGWLDPGDYQMPSRPPSSRSPFVGVV